MKTLEYLRMPCRFAVFFLLTCTLGSPVLSNDDPGYFGFGVTNNMMMPWRATGRNAATVVVNNEREFVDACNQNRPLIIEVAKSLDFMPQFRGDVNIKKNKIIRPAKTPDGKFIFVNLRGTLKPRGPNVILERLSIEGNADGVTLSGRNVRNIVIYKCDIFNVGDGYVDITGGASHVTIAYCKFWRWSRKYSGKGFLINTAGNGDDIFITMHHNWFARGLGTRVPKVGGHKGNFANVHLVNNYWDTKAQGRQVAIALIRKSHVVAEGSVFRASKNPWLYENLKNDTFDTNPDTKSHFKMTNTLFLLDRESGKDVRVGWSGKMYGFHKKNHLKPGEKDQPLAWEKFLPLTYDGPRFVFYRYKTLKPEDVPAHVMRHAGTKFPRTRRTGPVTPPASPQSVTSRQQG